MKHNPARWTLGSLVASAIAASLIAAEPANLPSPTILRGGEAPETALSDPPAKPGRTRLRMVSVQENFQDNGFAPEVPPPGINSESELIEPPPMEAPAPADRAPLPPDGSYFNVQPLSRITLDAGADEGIDEQGRLLPDPAYIAPEGADVTEPLSTQTLAFPGFRGHVSGFCHRPLYFEEPNLERYGYECCPSFCLAQPAVSVAKFYCNVASLPYKLASEPPCSYSCTCRYLYPAGTHAPPVRECPECSQQGLVAEAATIAGLILLIP